MGSADSSSKKSKQSAFFPLQLDLAAVSVGDLNPGLAAKPMSISLVEPEDDDEEVLEQSSYRNVFKSEGVDDQAKQMAREYRRRVSRLVADGTGYVQAKHVLEGADGIGRSLTFEEKTWLTDHIRLLTF